MKTYYLLPLLFSGFGVHAQVATSAVSQANLNFQAGTIYIEMNIPSGKAAPPETVEEKLMISPNPVTDYLYFITKETISKAIVYDMGGRKVMDCTVTDNTADLRQLGPGSYVIAIEGPLSQGHIFLKK